jgi:hypothetical protein
MKAKKSEKKLVLNKKTIADLHLNAIKGGATGGCISYKVCPNTNPTLCPSCAVDRFTNCV